MYVYVMFNKDKNVLYVGKTMDIKNRMGQHFGSQREEWKDDVCSIEYMNCHSEVDMAIYEIYLINKLNPIHNSSLRFKGDTELYLRPKLLPYRFRDISKREDVLTKCEKDKFKKLIKIHEDSSKSNQNSNFCSYKELKRNKDFILSKNWCSKNMDSVFRTIKNTRTILARNKKSNIKNLTWTYFDDLTGYDYEYVQNIKKGFNRNYADDCDTSEINVLAYLCNDIVYTDNRRDDYLSVLSLVDFIKRSAVSEGKEIYLYLPSKRMRELLSMYLDGKLTCGCK